MNDIECPYCNHEQEVNHDDGHGYEEDKLHQQQCDSCDKYFTYTTHISYYYDAYTADCLNDSEHTFKATSTYPKECTRMECTQCGETRQPTEYEMKIIMNGENNG